VPLALRAQTPCIFERRIRIVDRTWTHDDDDAIIVPFEDLMETPPGIVDEVGDRLGARNVA
jgi:hypothetical protein